MSTIKTLINNKYIILKKISSGSFGVVSVGQDTVTREQVAIKVEKSGHSDASLDREAQILQALQGIAQIPRLFFKGKEGDQHVMVISYLGRDLTHYLKTFRKFSLKCVLNIGEQMINVIESVHKGKVIHRDIKPENILIGRDDPDKLYLVDFGISKFYRDNNDTHISYKENQPFIGTTRYASISAHKGQSLSRKDDLESLAYMLIFLLKGSLPWQNVQYQNEQDRIKQVGLMKMKMEMPELCKGIPAEFGRILEYARGLPFKAEPNYKFLISLIKKLQLDQQCAMEFDWETVKKERKSKLKDSESNSNSDVELLKTPEHRKSSQLEVGRRKSRFASISSYNDSFSEAEQQSVMLGIQPSMLSRLSKLSFKSNSGMSNHSRTPEILSREQQKKNTLQQSPYIKALVSRSPQRNKSQQVMKQKIQEVFNEETVQDQSKMDEGDEALSIEKKYMLLKQNSVHAQ